MFDLASIFQLAIVFFLIANPIGSCPPIIALIKDYDIKTQQKIVLRETFFSLIIAFFFLFLGEAFLTRLNIKEYALTLSGGILILLISLKMIFSIPSSSQGKIENKHPPFIVPIATPLLAGPGLLTMIMVTSKQEANNLKLSLAIFVAWIGVAIVLFVAPYLQMILGKRGLSALEQLMGMLLAMMGIQMLVKGTALFLQVLGAA